MIVVGDMIWLKGRARWFRVLQTHGQIDVGFLGTHYHALVWLGDLVDRREEFMTQLDHDNEGLSWIHLGRERST